MIRNGEGFTKRSPCSFVCHGRCEYVMAKKIKSLLRLPISIYAESNGKCSIQVHGLLKFVAHQPSLRSREAYLRDNGINKSDAKSFFDHHKIIFLMDLDDASSSEADDYVSGRLFSKEWYAPYAMPIYFRPNLDAVTKRIGYDIDVRRAKPEQFELLILRNDDFFHNLAKTNDEYCNFGKAMGFLPID